MVKLTGDTLNIDELVRIAYGLEKVTLSDAASKKIEESHKKIVELAAQGTPLYGVNTGFGIFVDKRITKNQSVKLNRNLIYSHAVATGDPLPKPVVRAAIAVRINALANGVSGIQYNIVNTLISLLNNDAVPVIASKGSLGSSGDLCLLAQIGISIIDHEKDDSTLTGEIQYKGQVLSGKETLQLLGLEPIQFAYKDGLALINGATFSAAITALAVYEAKKLADLGEINTAMSLEALCGVSSAFHPGIHALRNMDGQQKSAKIINSLITGSSFVNSSDILQDAYSLRCAPQVHGSVRDTINHAGKVITAEINAATDNPLMVEDDLVISGGNFHGEPVGFVSDFLKIALTELGAISERRSFRLMDEKINNGLPGMLVDPKVDAGVNSGLMMLQYTAAALILQNKTLVFPDSTHSLPTSANQEDHNANSFNSALHLWEIIENTRKVLAIELYSAMRAIKIRMDLQPADCLGMMTQKVYDTFCSEFDYQPEDVQWRYDLEKLYKLLTVNQDFRVKILSVVN